MFFSIAHFLIVPILIVQGANGAGHGPAGDAMEVEGVLWEKCLGEGMLLDFRDKKIGG